VGFVNFPSGLMDLDPVGEAINLGFYVALARRPPVAVL
jgi:hypothetical protein